MTVKYETVGVEPAGGLRRQYIHTRDCQALRSSVNRFNLSVARLIPIGDRPATRVSGTAKGKVIIAPDFDAPLPDETLEAFEA